MHGLLALQIVIWTLGYQHVFLVSHWYETGMTYLKLMMILNQGIKNFEFGFLTCSKNIFFPFYNHGYSRSLTLVTIIKQMFLQRLFFKEYDACKYKNNLHL